jgi:hypothetical protein
VGPRRRGSLFAGDNLTHTLLAAYWSTNFLMHINFTSLLCCALHKQQCLEIPNADLRWKVLICLIPSTVARRN